MRLALPALTLASLLSAAFPLPALDVRFHPGEVVYPYEVDPDRGLSSVVIQQIALVQRDGGAVTLESLEIQALANGQALQTVMVPVAELDRAAQRLKAMEDQGLLKIYDFQLQTSRSLGEGVKVSPSRTLAPGTGLLVRGRALLLTGPTDQIAVTARARDAAGKPVEAGGTLRVEAYRPANELWFPLAGVVWVGAAPSLHSHHRWATNQEFALDLLTLSGDGNTHKGDGSRLEDYYVYGKDVLAVADGVVVEAEAGALEAHERLRQPGENADVFLKRTVVAQNELLAKSVKAPLGNFVVIRHAGGEHSYYAHLKQGSVRVKAGDTVKRGQTIGQVGHTGNSTEPHLHFQLTDGPDAMYSRGLPAIFKNIEADGLEGRQVQSGGIVVTKTARP